MDSSPGTRCPVRGAWQPRRDWAVVGGGGSCEPISHVNSMPKSCILQGEPPVTMYDIVCSGMLQP